MEIKQKLVWKENLDSNIVNDLLVRPNAGVAYVQETDKVYFNNVVLPQGGSRPEFEDELGRLRNRPHIDIEG